MPRPALCADSKRALVVEPSPQALKRSCVAQADEQQCVLPLPDPSQEDAVFADDAADDSFEWNDLSDEPHVIVLPVSLKPISETSAPCKELVSPLPSLEDWDAGLGELEGLDTLSPFVASTVFDDLCMDWDACDAWAVPL